MDLSSFKELGNLPFGTLTAGMLWHLLGPSAKYLGGKTQELTQFSVQNIERVFKHGIERLPAGAKSDGVVPPRVLRTVMNEGAFTEDEVAAAYLGGVLASSRTEHGRDDRGVAINALISRLSVFQLRLHYVCYMAIHYLFQGVETDFRDADKIRIHFGTDGLFVAMGFLEDSLRDPEFERVDSILTHALYGLSKEELISHWNFRGDQGLTCIPTPIGTELFLWANGQGRRRIEYLFDREFEPIAPADDISIMPGREVKVVLDDGKEAVLHGFDYVHGDVLHPCCKLPSLQLPTAGVDE